MPEYAAVFYKEKIFLTADNSDDARAAAIVSLGIKNNQTRKLIIKLVNQKPVSILGDKTTDNRQAPDTSTLRKVLARRKRISYG